jgi:hypothetical protein
MQKDACKVINMQYFYCHRYQPSHSATTVQQTRQADPLQLTHAQIQRAAFKFNKNLSQVPAQLLQQTKQADPLQPAHAQIQRAASNVKN